MRITNGRVAGGGCSSFCFIRHQAGDVGALASGRLSALLAVEIEKPGWPAADLRRVAGPPSSSISSAACRLSSALTFLTSVGRTADSRTCS